MKIEDQIAEGIPVWRKMVEDAGGEYEGVQMSFASCFDPTGYEPEPTVVFRRNGFLASTSLPVSQMSVEAVKQKLGIKTKHNVSELTRINFTGLEDKLREHLTPVRELLKEFLAVVDKIEEELKNAEK